MANKITIKNLENLCEHLNRITGNPVSTMTRPSDSPHLKYNVGNYTLDNAYGGYKLVQIVGDGGAEKDVLEIGYVSKPVLYDAIHLFLKGYTTATRKIA